jgi:hypothetical protein
MSDKRIDGSSLAGGLIATVLLDTLRNKGILSLDECRSILDKALRAVGPDIHSAEGGAASRLIAGLLSGHYSARVEHK